MNKLTKIGAAALFTLFLAACDKAADKPVEPAKPAETTTEAAKPVEATTTEAVKSAKPQQKQQNPLKQRLPYLLRKTMFKVLTISKN